MARFTPESLETLRQRVDLVEVLSAHLELKRAGGSYKALCPFHDEKTPSFTIKRGDTHYHCFGCGAHGDAIAFLMEHLQMSFLEAIESLAQRFGVALQRIEGGEREVNKRRLRDCLTEAARLYHFLLLHADSSEAALEYVGKRGMDLEFLQRFQIGFAPPQKLLRPLMEKRGFKLDDLKAVGLVGNRGSDFFVERILFPIHDAAGRVVGFSGRKFKESTFGGKYINTPETALFRKSELLFGLNESRRRIAKERRALLVEGQLDCLRLIHWGFDFAVAPLGTAFGEGHVRALAQLGVRDVMISFDADRAGREAAAKAGDLLQRDGIGVRVMVLSDKMDPDALLLEEGPEAIRRHIDEARDYVSFLVSLLREEIDMTSPAGKAELAREVSRRIHQWKDSVVIHESLRRLARILEIPEEMVGAGQQPLGQVQVTQSGHAGIGGVETADVLESDVVRWLLLLGEEREEVVELASGRLQETDFDSELCKRLFRSYLQLWREHKPRDLMGLSAMLGDEDVLERLSELLARKVNRERVKELFPQAIQRLLERNWMRRREEVRHRIQSGTLGEEEVMALAKEFETLKKQRPLVQWP